jgi:hypothetical protein
VRDEEIRLLIDITACHQRNTTRSVESDMLVIFDDFSDYLDDLIALDIISDLELEQLQDLIDADSSSELGDDDTYLLSDIYDDPQYKSFGFIDLEEDSEAVALRKYKLVETLARFR